MSRKKRRLQDKVQTVKPQIDNPQTVKPQGVKTEYSLLSGERDERLAVGGCLAAAFLSARSISYIMNLRGGVPFSAGVLAVFLWAGLAWIFLLTFKRWQREKADAGQDFARTVSRRVKYTAVTGFVLGVLYVAGCQLQWLGHTEPGFLGKGKLLFHGLCLGAAILPFADGGFAWVARATDSQDVGDKTSAEPMKKSAKKTVDDKKEISKWYVFLAGFAGIWILWIPVWLAYYPAIMSYDFHKQSLEALLGPKYFNNHHPLAHTWLIYVFRNLGEKIGSYETGFALFSLLQQMVTAAVLGYACVVIYRLVRRKWAVAVSILFFGCFPLISVFVMCTTKDVLFGAFFLLFLLLMIEVCLSGEKKPVHDLALMAAGILMILFRNNALYAVLPFGVLYLILCGKEKRIRAVILIAVLLLGGKGALMGLQYGFHAHKGSEIEKYSVIYQSMARVGNRQGAILSEEDHILLDKYVTEECWADYNPPLADTIKSPVQKINFNEKKSWSDMGAVFAAWAKIGLHYPNEYIDAFLDLTRGYWFMDDTSHAEMLGVGLEERMGLLYTYNSAAEESLPGMQHISRFPWLEERLERLLSANEYTGYPVISVLFKPALWCLLPIVAVVWFCYRRDRKAVCVLLYPICYFATMLLGPTAIIRYVYPFILSAPVILAVIFRDRSGEEIKQ